MSIQNPFFYNDSPLIVEQVCYLLKKVIEQEKTFEEIKKELYEIDEKIASIIEDYYNTGLFDEILTKIFNEWINEQKKFTKTSKPIVKRIWRRFNITGINDTFNESECYSYAQGAVAFNYKNITPRYAIINVKKTRLTTGVENNQLALYNPNSQNPIATAVLPIGHGQDITYQYDEKNNKSYFYIVHSSDNQITPSNSITRVEMLNDTTISTDYLTKNFDGVQPYQICYYNNMLYMYANKNVYIVDFENATYTLLCSLNIGGTINGFLVNDIGIWLTNGENVVLFNMKGEIIYTYNIGTVSTDKYLIGEIESLSSDPTNPNNIMIFSFHTLGVTSALAQRVLTEAFIFNPITNNIEIEPQYYETYSGREAILYVDGSLEYGSNNLVNDYANNIINPNGNIDNPFHNLQEALDYFTQLPQQALKLRLRRSDRCLFINLGYNVEIENYEVISETEITHIIIGGILCGYGGNITFRIKPRAFSIWIAATFNKDIGEFSENIGSCAVRYGTITITGNVQFFNNLENYHPTINGLNGYYSNIFLYSSLEAPTFASNKCNVII